MRGFQGGTLVGFSIQDNQIAVGLKQGKQAYLLGLHRVKGTPLNIDQML